MNNVEIIDIDGNKVKVSGIYYISTNNNYYFIYTKGEKDNDSHVIFYIVKILQEVTNSAQVPTPTGYLIGLKINDDNEYDMVKKDIASIINDKENSTKSVRYLELSMLNNLKIKDNRTFKLGIETYNKIFNNTINNVNDNTNVVDTTNNTIMVEDNNYDELIKENDSLKQQINELNKKIQIIKDIVN